MFVTAPCPLAKNKVCSAEVFLARTKLTVLAELRWPFRRSLSIMSQRGESRSLNHSPDVLAYTATHGEAEEDCEAPSSTEAGAEQQSE